MRKERNSSTILYLDTRWQLTVSLTPATILQGKKLPNTNLIGGFMCPRAGLDAMHSLPGIESKQPNP
jgi:hypothetical protein